MKFQIHFKNIRPLIAVASCRAGKKEIMECLQGVHIKGAKGGGVILCATNRHQLMAIRDTEVAIGGSMPKEGVVITGNFPKPSKKVSECSGVLTINNESKRSLLSITTKGLDGKTSLYPIEIGDQPFPDVYKLLPDCEIANKRHVNIAPGYLKHITEICKLFDDDVTTILSVGDGKIYRVMFEQKGFADADMIYIIMGIVGVPMKSKTPMPKWTKEIKKGVAK